MYGRWKRSNSPTPSNTSRATQDTEPDLPTLGRKRSKSEPKVKTEADLEMELMIREVRERREAEEKKRLEQLQGMQRTKPRSIIEESKQIFEEGEARLNRLKGTSDKIEESK